MATHIYKLPQSSLAELARNSVRQSGFEMEVKRHWIGDHWYLPGAAGNDIHRVRDLFQRDRRIVLTLTVDERPGHSACVSASNSFGRVGHDPWQGPKPFIFTGRTIVTLL